MHVTRLAVQSDNTSGECHILAMARRMTEALADQLVISREQGIERLRNAMRATVQPGQAQRVIRGRNQRGTSGTQHARAKPKLRVCSRALPTGPKPGLASCSQVAAGDRWLVMAIRGHLGDTGP